MRKTASNHPTGHGTKHISDQNAKTLQHLAFENSLQPQLITNTTNGKILLANAAACDLFNYSCAELLTRKRASLFGLSERLFKELLIEDSMSIGSYPLSVKVVRKNGEVLICEITGTVFTAADGKQTAILNLMDRSGAILRQKQIDSGKEKIVADNIALANAMQKIVDIKKDKRVVDDIIRALAKSDARLAENNEWKKYIGKTSYDVIWDWEIGSAVIYVSDSLLEVFGYKVVNNKIRVTEIANWILAEEKRSVALSLSAALASHANIWNASFLVKYHNGSFAATTARASIVRNAKGKAIRMIGALQDISRLKELEKKLEEQIIVQEELTEIFVAASRLSFDASWDWNLLTNELILGEGFQELFGYQAENDTGEVAITWSTHIHASDRVRVETSLNNAVNSHAADWESAYRFIKSDGTVARVLSRASIIRDAGGKALRIIGVLHDNSQQEVLEERLQSEILSKSRQIADAAEQAKEMERSEIGKELHDNVNQLLGVSKLYLDLARKGGDNASEHMSRSSQYTLTAIDEIRKLTKGLTTDVIQQLGLCHAIENIASETMQVQSFKIRCLLCNFIEASVEDKFKINIFRIVQEQLNNIVKHAKATRVTIELSQSTHLIVLAITDNGEGFDTSLKHDGIGIENIKTGRLLTRVLLKLYRPRAEVAN